MGTCQSNPKNQNTEGSKVTTDQLKKNTKIGKYGVSLNRTKVLGGVPTRPVSAPTPTPALQNLQRHKQFNEDKSLIGILQNHVLAIHFDAQAQFEENVQHSSSKSARHPPTRRQKKTKSVPEMNGQRSKSSHRSHQKRPSTHPTIQEQHVHQGPSKRHNLLQDQGKLDVVKVNPVHHQEKNRKTHRTNKSRKNDKIQRQRIQARLRAPKSNVVILGQRHFYPSDEDPEAFDSSSQDSSFNGPRKKNTKQIRSTERKFAKPKSDLTTTLFLLNGGKSLHSRDDYQSHNRHQETNSAITPKVSNIMRTMPNYSLYMSPSTAASNDSTATANTSMTLSMTPCPSSDVSSPGIEEENVLENTSALESAGSPIRFNIDDHKDDLSEADTNQLHCTEDRYGSHEQDQDENRNRSPTDIISNMTCTNKEEKVELSIFMLTPQEAEDQVISDFSISSHCQEDLSDYIDTSTNHHSSSGSIMSSSSSIALPDTKSLYFQTSPEICDSSEAAERMSVVNSYDRKEKGNTKQHTGTVKELQEEKELDRLLDLFRQLRLEERKRLRLRRWKQYQMQERLYLEFLGIQQLMNSKV